MHGFELTDLSGLSQLKKLDVTGCDKLTLLPEDLSGLQTLEIFTCPALTALPDCLSGLQKLKIYACHALERLPENLLQLTELKLDYCHGLLALPDNLAQLNNRIIVNCPHLEPHSPVAVFPSFRMAGPNQVRTPFLNNQVAQSSRIFNPILTSRDDFITSLEPLGVSHIDIGIVYHAHAMSLDRQPTIMGIASNPTFRLPPWTGASQVPGPDELQAATDASLNMSTPSPSSQENSIQKAFKEKVPSVSQTKEIYEFIKVNFTELSSVNGMSIASAGLSPEGEIKPVTRKVSLTDGGDFCGAVFDHDEIEKTEWCLMSADNIKRSYLLVSLKTAEGCMAGQAPRHPVLGRNLAEGDFIRAGEVLAVFSMEKPAAVK